MTPYQIYEATSPLEGRKRTLAINRLFRAQDESHLWPSLGRFNATNRAIRRVQATEIQDPLEYCNAIDAELSYIVNNL